jgi:hemerythrin
MTGGLMPLVTWLDDYSIENERLDDHHKLLFELINKLGRGITEKNNVQLELEVLLELENYAMTHFVYEEIYMLDISYKDMENHIAQHNLFRAKVHELRQLYSGNGIAAKQEVIEYLKKWAENHIVTEDKKIALSKSGKS